VPIEAFGRLLGVVFLDSREDLRFGYDDEDALVALAAQLGSAVRALQCDAEAGGSERPAAAPLPQPQGQPVEVRRYRTNDSVFIGGPHLVKGVPGAILWKLLKTCQDTGRCDFSNRELRLAAAELRLPEVTDNLEARLILLQRRLAERCPELAIEKTGRGQFRLKVARAVKLVEADA